MYIESKFEESATYMYSRLIFWNLSKDFKSSGPSFKYAQFVHFAQFDHKTALPVCQFTIFFPRSNSAIDDRNSGRSRSRSRFFPAIDDLDLDRTQVIDRSQSISIAHRSRQLWAQLTPVIQFKKK